MEQHAAKELHFEVANLRVSRTVRAKNKGPGQSGDATHWVNLTVQDANVFKFETMRPTNEAQKLSALLEHSGCNDGAIIAAPLASLKPSSFYTITVDFKGDGALIRHAEKALVFVQGTQATKPTPKGDGQEVVSSELLDLLNPDAPLKYIFSGFAEQGEFLKYLIDKNAALVTLSGVPSDPAKDAFTIQSVQRVAKADVEQVLKTMQHLVGLSTGCAPAGNKKRTMTFTSPTSTDKKCKTLAAWPSDASSTG